MTSGERWTVYPLILLALGLAVRAAVLSEEAPDSPLERLEADRIECRELIVRDADGTVVLQLPSAALTDVEPRADTRHGVSLTPLPATERPPSHPVRSRSGWDSGE